MELSNHVKGLFLETRSPGSACVPTECRTVMTMKYLWGQKINSCFFFLFLNQPCMFTYPIGDLCFFTLQTTWRCRFSFYLPCEYRSFFSHMPSQSNNTVCANSFRQDDHEICALVSREAKGWMKGHVLALSLRDGRALVLLTCKPFLSNLRVQGSGLKRYKNSFHANLECPSKNAENKMKTCL